MEKEEREQRGGSRSLESEISLQWGIKKRLRCVRVRDPHLHSHKSNSNAFIKRKFNSPFDRFSVSSATDKENSFLQSTFRVTRSSEAEVLRSSVTNNRESSSPEKDDRYYTTRGSVDADEKAYQISMNGANRVERGHVWPKLCITLTSKEKEEDFMTMKGCKLPQRPKKRAKMIQRSLLLVSPGAWLTDMCQERYEVREKKSSRKKPRGLKALGGSMDSDSD